MAFFPGVMVELSLYIYIYGINIGVSSATGPLFGTLEKKTFWCLLVV